jgi:uncharacterized protein (TIGR02099 family)
LRWIAGVGVALAVLTVLVVVGLRIAFERLPEYQQRVAVLVREATGLRLSFDSLDARVGLYGPEIYFAGARVVDPDGEVLVTAKSGRASLAPLRSLWFRRIEIGRILLESPRLNLLIFPDRHVELVGQSGFTRPPAEPRRPFTLDRVPRGTLEIRDATLAFRDLGPRDTAWEVTSVDIELRRRGGTIQVRGDVKLPAQLGRELEFDGEAEGELARFSSVAWRARVTASDVDLEGVAGLVPAAFPAPAAGAGSFRLAARGQGRTLQRARAAFSLGNVTLPEAPPAVEPGPVPDLGNVTVAEVHAPAEVTYTRLGGDIVMESIDDGWSVTGRQLEFSRPGARWKPSGLDGAVHLDAAHRLTRASVRTGFFRAENLMPLARLLPASPLRDRLEALDPRGTLRDVDLEVEPAGGRQMPDLTGSATFEDVGFAPITRFPGVTGVDGRFEGHGPEGVLHLDAADVELDWPMEWRAPVPLEHVRATLSLVRALGGVQLAADDAEVRADHGEASGRFRMLARPGETPLMDIDASAKVSDVSAISRYLPKDRMSPQALAWLDRALPRGRVSSAAVQITGPVRGFPYREGEGRFTAIAQAEDVTLDYAPGWTPLTGVSGRAEFTGTSMRVTGALGTVGGLRFRDGRADVEDWRESRLVVRAEAAGEAGAVHDFFRTSPVAANLGSIFPRLSVSGPVEGEVVMYLPIKEFSRRSIVVHGRAGGVTLALDGFAEPAQAVEGEFWVRDREFHAPALSARFLGGETTASIASSTAPDGEVLTRVEAGGVADAGRLPRILRLPANAGLEGRTAWRGNWRLTRPANPADPVRNRARLESELAGLASGLPAPLGKRAEERRSLVVDLESESDDALYLRAALGSSLRSLFEVRREEAGWRLSRGTVRLGGREVGALPVAPGLGVDGRVSFLSLTDLTSLRWDTPGRTRLEDLLTSVTLDVGRLEVLGYEFEGVNGRLRPGYRAWDVEVSAPAVRGRLAIPYEFPGSVPLVADLDLLRVAPRVREGDGDADPRRLPAMRLDVRDLTFLEWQLGHLSARLEQSGQGLEVERFALKHPAFAAQGSGWWRGSARDSLCALDFGLDSTDVMAFLEAMDLAPVLEARKGHLEATVKWPGAPDSRLLERISGTARVNLAKGRVLSVEPGAGRILGLMSLSHLGKRLALDFDDLTGQGLAFDAVKGDFTLADGVAFTDNLTLRGAAAEVGIAGRTSLRDRTYDQTAVVTGDLGASLGVAGAIAGGPAVGAALLLFSQIFKEPLKGVARAYYRITGPWEDPLVRKIDARELEEAAGLGLAPPGDGGTKE